MGRAAGYPVDEQDVIKLPAVSAYIIGLVAEWWVYLTSFGRRKAEINRRSLSFCVINQTFNIDKAKRQLGYRPVVGVDEGIRKSVAPLLEEMAKSK